MSSDNVGIAFALVIAAAASTGLGAAVVFFPSLIKLANRSVLARALAFAAGVMIFVSFVDIYDESVEFFISAGYEENLAFIYATLSFFGGVATMYILEAIVQVILGDDHLPEFESFENDPSVNSAEKQLSCRNRESLEHEHDQAPVDDERPVVTDEQLVVTDDCEVVGETSKPPDISEDTNEKTEVDKKLLKMGLNTAVAIGLHNFPEGLATFVATLSDPRVGGVVAVAIVVHNIPEGLCVALPVYYATGNRCKAFLWAMMSGATEVLAAFLGWLVLARVFGDTTYAIVFGLVGGMMVTISAKDLLPTAHFHDPNNTVATNSFVGGMAFMAMSLVLFQL